MKTSTDRVLKLIKGDSKFKRLSKAFADSPIYNIPRERMLDEIKEIHELRESRRLNRRDPDFVDKLVEANIRDMASRSRLTAIIATCAETSDKLTLACKSLKQHMLLTYPEHLRQYRTKEERILILDMAMRKYLNYVDQVNSIKEIAILVVNDIDKAAWSLKLIVETLKITSGRETAI